MDVGDNGAKKSKYSPMSLTRQGKLPKRTDPDYFYRVFDLYGVSNCARTKAELRKEVELIRAAKTTKPAGRQQKRKNYNDARRNVSVFKSRRKTLRNLRPLKQLGIRDLYVHRPCYSQILEKWVDAKLPYYLTSIATNGLEVKVTLVTLVPKAEGGNGGPKNADNQPLPEGTGGLAKKKYDGVTGVLDLDVHRQGVFKKSKEHAADVLDHIGIGVDPGRIEVFARVQVRMTSANPEEEFSKTDLIRSQVMFSGERYKALSLRANGERHKVRRRRSNLRYGEAVRELGKTTLKII